MKLISLPPHGLEIPELTYVATYSNSFDIMHHKLLFKDDVNKHYLIYIVTKLDNGLTVYPYLNIFSDVNPEELVNYFLTDDPKSVQDFFEHWKSINPMVYIGNGVSMHLQNIPGYTGSYVFNNIIY